MNLGLSAYFHVPKKPATQRITVAKYPDGHEIRIEPARGCGRNMWTYDQGAAVGPGKAAAIAQAKYEGATIETRIARASRHGAAT